MNNTAHCYRCGAVLLRGRWELVTAVDIFGGLLGWTARWCSLPDWWCSNGHGPYNVARGQ